MYYRHHEFHRIERIGWLRAAVLGANDGIISISSLLLGVAAANMSQTSIIVAAAAALISGAMSMAAGEYISVSSQADAEEAEIQREKFELETNLPAEIEELKSIYVQRGLEPELAKKVAHQLMAHDATGAHLRDELGITTELRARPIQAALFSAGSFTVGALLPILIAMFTPTAYFMPIIFLMAVTFLAVLGGVSAKIGGANLSVSVTRVAIWGTLAMSFTAIVGHILGIVY